MKLAAIVIATSLVAGCSFAMVRRAPPEDEPLTWPRCTEHRAYPLIDATYAVAFAALTAYFATDDDDLALIGVGFTVPAVIGLTTSAIYGWKKTSRCGAVREAYERAAREGR